MTSPKIRFFNLKRIYSLSFITHLLCCARMRLVIDGIIFGLQKAGGISRAWAEALVGLDQSFALKNKVYVLVPNNSNLEWERISSRLQNIQIVKRKRFKWERGSFFRESLYLTYLATFLKADLWHSSYYVGVPFTKCRKICMLYDMIPEVLGQAKAYDTEMKYRVLGKAEKIISISHHSGKDLVQFWPEFEKKIKIVHLCRQEKTVLGEESDWVSFPYFLFVGKRKGYKNFINVLREILSDSQFDNYHLIAAGGEPNWSPEENQIIKQYRAEGRVHCEGVLPYDEIQRLISLSTVVLYPSIYEGFGLPILEAFDHEIPVLACNSSSVPEITGSEYPLADPKDPKSLADTLARLLNEKEKWNNYAKQRLHFFQKPQMIEAWEKIYESLL